MAMTLSISAASDALPQHSHQTSIDSSSSNNSSNNDNISTSIDQQLSPSSGPRRKPSRRANTAERRATHNAVERQRRETLNGRFLDLAVLLPNLSQIRRPSKSSIVNSSIAHIQASRRHRLVASRELKVLKNEADALRRELNEWRDRASLPRVDEPIRGEGFGMVFSGELEMIQGVAIEEEDEDAEDSFVVNMPMNPMHSMPQPTQQQQTFNVNPPYTDNAAEDEAIFGAMYMQQQNDGVLPIHLAQHQMNSQVPMMSNHPHGIPTMLKTQNSFVSNIPPTTVPSTGYPTMNARNANFGNGLPNWIPTQVNVNGFVPGMLDNGSASGSPVGGVSVNGSPASSTSTLSSLGSRSPLSMVPSQTSPGVRRRRSGSLTGSSPSGQSPVYELQPAHSVTSDFTGVPRMGGMNGPNSFVPSHHSIHGMQFQPQMISVGGGGNGFMMI